MFAVQNRGESRLRVENNPVPRLAKDLSSNYSKTIDIWKIFLQVRPDQLVPFSVCVFETLTVLIQIVFTNLDAREVMS